MTASPEKSRSTRSVRSDRAGFVWSPISVPLLPPPAPNQHCSPTHATSSYVTSSYVTSSYVTQPPIAPSYATAYTTAYMPVGSDEYFEEAIASPTMTVYGTSMAPVDMTPQLGSMPHLESMSHYIPMLQGGVGGGDGGIGGAGAMGSSAVMPRHGPRPSTAEKVEQNHPTAPSLTRCSVSHVDGTYVTPLPLSSSLVPMPPPPPSSSRGSVSSLSDGYASLDDSHFGSTASMRRRFSSGVCSFDGSFAPATPPLMPPHVFKSPMQTSSPAERFNFGSFRRTPGASRPPLRTPFRYPSHEAKLPSMSSGSSSLLSIVDLLDEPAMPIQLSVSNLDYNISAREWKRILTSTFQQQVNVLGVHVQTQPDNTSLALITVSSVDEARFAISQFHRKKIGYKRIHVALLNGDGGGKGSDVRAEVSSLLMELAVTSMPLYKFIEIFEKRYHRSISVSELYRMRDTIEIGEAANAGRTISLLQSATPSSDGLLFEEGDASELPLCRLHCREGTNAYIDALDMCMLPNVQLQMKGFSLHVHRLLQSHEGGLPLASFMVCYEAEFSSKLTVVNEGGASLEHLVSCVPGVKVDISAGGIKKVSWAHNAQLDLNSPLNCSSPVLTLQLSQFSREMVDLLKTNPSCRLALSKFIPSYHQHFGRQCRVADYGYTKLMELFEAIPHVVQILGAGSRRVITLSHRAQVKRFYADLQRVLKSQISRLIQMLELPVIYQKVIGRPFNITEYGICYIEDILCELPETAIEVGGIGSEMVIGLPRREQTGEEQERTRQFSSEVVDLLKHSPQCRMPFNKFIPAYHHHFNKQCRVADYGFTKLLELFESIPKVVAIDDEDEEKVLCLTQTELIGVLEEQVRSLLLATPEKALPVSQFMDIHSRAQGHCVRLADFGVSSVSELIALIPETSTVLDGADDADAVIVLVDRSEQERIVNRVLVILMEQPDGSMSRADLLQTYAVEYGIELDSEALATHMEPYIKITDDNKTVKLKPLMQLARDARSLLSEHKTTLTIQQFEDAFAEMFGVELVPATYGKPSVGALLHACPLVIRVHGKGFRKTVELNPFYRKLNITAGKPDAAQHQTLSQREWYINDPAAVPLMPSRKKDAALQLQASCSDETEAHKEVGHSDDALGKAIAALPCLPTTDAQHAVDARPNTSCRQWADGAQDMTLKHAALQLRRLQLIDEEQPASPLPLEKLEEEELGAGSSPEFGDETTKKRSPPPKKKICRIAATLSATKDLEDQ